MIMPVESLKGLKEQVGQLLAKNKGNIEIIIINSSEISALPGEAEELKRLNEKIIYAEIKGPPYQLWNHGVMMAGGKYLTILLPGESFLDTWPDLVIAEFEKQPEETGVIYAETFTQQGGDKKKYLKTFKKWDRHLLLEKNFLHMAPVFWRSRLHEEYGYFDEDNQSGIYEFLLRVSQTSGFYYFENAVSVSILTEPVKNEAEIARKYKDAAAARKLIKRAEEVAEVNFEVQPEIPDGLNYPPFYISGKCTEDLGFLNKDTFSVLLEKRYGREMAAENSAKINADFDQIWVPGEYQKALLAGEGVDTNKTRLLPAVAEPVIKRGLPVKIETGKSFKFFCLNDGSFDIDLLINNFCSEFSPDEDVCLLVTDPSNIIRNYGQEEEGLVFWGAGNEKSVRDLIGASDCLVFPFGRDLNISAITGAMAGGIPVIVTEAGPVTGLCNSENAFLIRQKEENPESGKFFPDLDEAVRQMRYVFTNRETAAGKAEKALKTIREKFSAGPVLEKLYQYLGELKQSIPFRSNYKKIVNGWEKEAYQYFDEKNFIKAENMFQRLCLYENSNSEYYYRLGLTRFMQGKYREAVMDLAVSLEYGMFNRELCQYLAQALEKSGEDEMAGLYYEKIKKHFSD